MASPQGSRLSPLPWGCRRPGSDGAGVRRRRPRPVCRHRAAAVLDVSCAAGPARTYRLARRRVRALPSTRRGSGTRQSRGTDTRMRMPPDTSGIPAPSGVSRSGRGRASWPVWCRRARRAGRRAGRSRGTPPPRSARPPRGPPRRRCAVCGPAPPGAVPVPCGPPAPSATGCRPPRAVAARPRRGSAPRCRIPGVLVHRHGPHLTSARRGRGPAPGRARDRYRARVIGCAACSGPSTPGS